VRPADHDGDREGRTDGDGGAAPHVVDESAGIRSRARLGCPWAALLFSVMAPQTPWFCLVSSAKAGYCRRTGQPAQIAFACVT
jgi:hypothetical protein